MKFIEYKLNSNFLYGIILTLVLRQDNKVQINTLNMSGHKIIQQLKFFLTSKNRIAVQQKIIGKYFFVNNIFILVKKLTNIYSQVSQKKKKYIEKIATKNKRRKYNMNFNNILK